MFKIMPSNISILDHMGARLLWDLVQMEVEKNELQTERQRKEEKEKKYYQFILDSLPYRIMVVNMNMTVERVNQNLPR